MREIIGQPNKNREAFDFYSTNPECVRDIIRVEDLNGLSILETSVGNGHIAKELIASGNKVFGVDIVQRDYPVDLVQDFLTTDLKQRFDVAVYNPPFKYLGQFIEKAWEYTDKQIIFARLQFLESIGRYENIFKHGYLERVYVYSERQTTNDNPKANSMCFCWFVLSKNNKNPATVEWL